MQDFRQLKVWEKAHQLTLAVYQATRDFPREEAYGLTSQLRRCSASVPANIAEGCGRGSNADLARFLHIALGSASELDYHLLLARDLGLLTVPDYTRLAATAAEVKRMLTGLLARIQGERAVREESTLYDVTLLTDN